MTFRGFQRAGHWPTLLAAFLYFDVSFMVWVMLGPLGPFLSESLSLSGTQKGLLVALPLLAGSVFRPVLGALADRWGGRRTGLLGLGLTLLPLLLGWQWARSLEQFYMVAVLLGVAGASFAVALPLAGRWYPPEYQGLAMGIAGAGNSGTLFATLFAPRLATAFGWPAVFGLALLPVLVVVALFALLAKDSPNRPPVTSGRDYAAVLAEPDAGWFCFLYCLTFGTFVGLASFLTLFFYDQYGLAKVTAGDFTTVAVLAGSFLRPVGGFLSDRLGGYRLLLGVLCGVGVCLLGVGALPPVSLALALLVVAMGLLGMGNGAVFQLLPQRFPERVGILTGLVGAAGGLGGFALPFLLGWMRDRTGHYGSGLLVCGVVLLVGAACLLQLGHVWLGNWSEAAARRAGLFSFRGQRPVVEQVEA